MKGVKVMITIENQRDETFYIGRNDTITQLDGYPLNGNSSVLLDVTKHKIRVYGFFKDEETERLV
jgi:hypothetical protein